MLYKRISRFFILLLFIVSPVLVYGHNPSLSGTLLYQVDDHQWTLQVRASLTSFEYEVHNEYGKDSYSTPEEFKELVIKLLSENITISFNDGNDVKLIAPIVRLGHETKVIFQINDLPITIQSLDFKNSSFKNITKNKNLLVIATKDETNNKFTLNNENHHFVKLIVDKTGFKQVVNEQQTVFTNPLMLTIASVLLMSLLGYVVYRHKRNKPKN